MSFSSVFVPRSGRRGSSSRRGRRSGAGGWSVVIGVARHAQLRVLGNHVGPLVTRKRVLIRDDRPAGDLGRGCWTPKIQRFAEPMDLNGSTAPPSLIRQNQ